MDNKLKVVEKLNDNVVEVIENPYVKYGFLIFIVARIMFIDHVDEWFLELFNYTWFKIMYALFIAYSACFDPVYSIALATFIIICIQELYLRKAKRNLTMQKEPVSVLLDSSTAQVQQLPTNPINVKLPELVYETIPDEKTLINDESISNIINKHTLQKTPVIGDKLISGYDFIIDPAYKTITNNIQNGYIEKNKFQITENNLLEAQGLPNGFEKGNPKFNL